MIKNMLKNLVIVICAPALSVIYQSIIRAGEREMKPVVG